MSNLITDPGFELGTGWTYFRGAEQSSDTAFAGTYSGKIPFLPGGFAGGLIEQTGLLTIPGEEYAVAMQANGAIAFGESVIVSVDPGDGNYAEIGRLDSAVGWTSWLVGSFTAVGMVSGIRIGTSAPHSGHTWYVDEIVMDVPMEVAMAIGKWAAIDAAITAIKTINGGAYFTDLEGRVYTRLVTPNEGADIKMPYVCIPLNGEAETFEYEDRMGRGQWSLTIWAFFKEPTGDDPYNTTTAQACANFRDDIVKAFMADQTLSRTVNNSEIVSINTVSGILDDYAEVQAIVSFDQYFSATDLV